MTKIDLDDVLFAICLDSLGKPIITDTDSHASNGMYAHVSRPPREGAATFEFFKKMEELAVNSSFEVIHKKINLASEMLAWDHERFSLNKIPAFTLSHFKSFKDADRNTMTDTM